MKVAQGVDALKSSGKNDVISRAIDEIKKTRFGQTALGREVIARLEELHEAGKITVQNIGKFGGLGGAGNIKISPSVYAEIDSEGKRAHLESVLVHEALHELQAKHNVALGHQHGSTFDPYGFQNIYLAELRSQGRVTRSRPSQ